MLCLKMIDNERKDHSSVYEENDGITQLVLGVDINYESRSNRTLPSQNIVLKLYQIIQSNTKDVSNCEAKLNITFTIH